MSNEKVEKIKAPFVGLEKWRKNNVPAQVWDEPHLKAYLKKRYIISGAWGIIIALSPIYVRIFGMVTSAAFSLIGVLCIYFGLQKWRKNNVPAQVWDEPHLKAYLKKKARIAIVPLIIMSYVAIYTKIFVLGFYAIGVFGGIYLYYGFKK